MNEKHMKQIFSSFIFTPTLSNCRYFIAYTLRLYGERFASVLVSVVGPISEPCGGVE